MVFSASPLFVGQYLLFKNCLSHNLVLRIWGWYNEYLLFDSCPLPHWLGPVRQYLPFKNGLSHNPVLRIWGWYNEYPLFEMVFPVSPWVVRQYLLFRNGLSHTLVLRIWGWYNEYLLFENGLFRFPIGCWTISSI